MKKTQSLWRRSLRLSLALLLCLTMLPSAALAEGTDIPINETSFPDTNFRSYILKVLDTDKNEALSESEIDVVTSITLEDPNNSGVR